METETFKIRLTKLSSEHEHLRTDVVDGVIHKEPKLYESLEIYAKSLNPEAIERYIKTSPIIDIEYFDQVGISNIIIFKTVYSKYKLEYT
jgi:hypothetical protein